MLRYILLKLPGFTSKTEYPAASSPCNQIRMFRSISPIKKETRREPTKNEQPKLLHRRSYSFPSTKPKSYSFFNSELEYATNKKSSIQKIEERNVIQKKGIHQMGKTCAKKISTPHELAKSEKCDNYSTNSGKKVRTNKYESKNIYDEDQFKNMEQVYETENQYELEAARPRKSQSEFIFNVLDYIPNDPARYLQPNQQRPFGSSDNTYLPLFMENRVANVSQFNTEHGSNYDLQESPPAKNNYETEGKKKQQPIYASSEMPLEQIKEADLTAAYSNEKKNREYSSKDLDSYNKIIQKHKDLNPSYVSKRLSPKVDEKKLVNEAVEVAEKCKIKLSNSKGDKPDKYLEEALIGRTIRENKNNLFESYRLKWNEPGIKIEPPPFVNSEDMYSSIDPEYLEKTPKQSDKYIQVPWPAYSDRIKKNVDVQRSADDVETADGNCAEIQVPRNTSQNQTLQKQLTKIQPQYIQRGNMHSSSDKSLDSVNVTPTQNETKKSKSSIYITKVPNKNPVSTGTLSLTNKKVYTSSTSTYAKSSNTAKPFRQLEPPSCKKDEESRKCFLPSKIRLKPPPCLTRPPYNCKVENPCPPRADQCYRPCPKKLPILQVNKCPCVEPEVPETNPKMRRLKLKFVDPPRICPCNPCPCQPRADDLMKEKKKCLPQFKPGNCKCVEPPAMEDIPLIRLKKICEPEAKCYPKAECPKPDPCIRADDNRIDCPKFLPVLQTGNCPCVEPMVPDSSPKMRRLKMVFKDTPRECPCDPCPCGPRADDSLKEKIRQLPIYKPGFCACVEPPEMTDVPLKRLVKVCPQEVCYPKRVCPVEVCDESARADFCLKLTPKKLPILKATKCACVEPEVPDKNPKMKRLKMVLKDEPRKCDPINPCPPRADDTLKPKQKKLPVYVPGECKCIEPPPLTDVPLIKLKKICEPEAKCYPPIECPKPILCKDKPRADDNLCVRTRKLPKLESIACPCVEPPEMTDAPKLKRLDLHVAEPVKYCPKLTCADFPRADDTLTDKDRKLPILKAGACPCIEQPMVDVKPLPRLKCKEEAEPCDCDDPCIPYPRADWGCWEYMQNATNEINKYKKIDKKKKNISVNTKRRFNTDSTVNFSSKRNSKSNKKNEIRKLSVDKMLKSDEETKLKSLNVNKFMEKSVKNKPKSKINFKTVPSDTAAENVRFSKSTAFCALPPNKSTSLPTFLLLRKLSDLEKSEMFTHTNHNQPTSNANVRQLSTEATSRQENATRRISTGNVTNFSKKDCNTKKPGPCKKMNPKCDKVVLKNCPQKDREDCKKERIPVCCEKKPSPTPAFSECMDEEIEPYSRKVTNWTCNHRPYGIDVKRKKPENLKKYKKHFSTTVSSGHQHTKTSNVKTIQEGYKTLQLHSSHILCPRRVNALSQTNFSSTTNNINDTNKLDFPVILSKELFNKCTPQFPRYESNFRKGKSNKKDCKKKDCPKFNLPNCPPKARQNCDMDHTIHCTKPQTPYPAFSDCLDQVTDDSITECPIERDRIAQLQPKRPMDKPKLVEPIVPAQGIIDPSKEEDCVRAKYCVEQEGITQCCDQFGKTIKPLRQKDFPQEKDRDCNRIEELKKLGKWPPASDSKRFCTSTSNFFNTQQRALWSSATEFTHMRTKKVHNVCGVRNRIKTILTSKTSCVRNYHVLCNNAERNVVDDVDVKIKYSPQNNFADIDEPDKFMNLRNVRWRINNFQKWRRLNKNNTLYGSVKRYHTCSKLKRRRYVRNSRGLKKFSTAQAKNISLSESYDSSALRGISTTMILSKSKSTSNYGKRVKNHFQPKSCNVNKTCPKFKLPNCPARERFICKRKRPESNCEKVVTPYPAFSECHDEEVRDGIMECPLGKERIQRLQPQYPLVPEIETVNLPPPYQGRIDPHLEMDYIRHKMGVTNEGLSQDCETFGKPFKYLRCKDIEGFKPSNKSNMSTQNNCEQNKAKNRLCSEKCIPQEEESNEVRPPDCAPRTKPVCEDELTLWQRVVNYFKARPNCPAPDEWKKKALRDKAEKAARAAGLCLVEPKDLPKKCDEVLPKVITPQDRCDFCEGGQKKKNCPRPVKKKCTLDSPTNRRHFGTLSRRYYSRNVNWKCFDDFNKLIEEDENPGTVKKSLTHVMDKTNLSNETSNIDEDVSYKSPDAYCEKVFNEAILNKNKIDHITKFVDIDINDEPIIYSLNIGQQNKESMNIVFNTPVDEFSNHGQTKPFAVYDEYFNKVETLTELSYEDREITKTNNLINELNKLLTKKEE